ncbi:efflux RND transporter permease subunit [Candidatus Sumerlaeota bacterium]
MHVSKIAIHRPVTTLMFTLALVFLGLISYRELAVQRLPDITFPSMYYWARLPEGDLSSEQTNDELTRPFEKMVASLKGVKEMYSNTRPGQFWGYAQFDSGTDMRFRVIELQDKVNKWLSSRPTDGSGQAGGEGERIDTGIVPASTEDYSARLMEIILAIPPGQETRIAAASDMIRRKLKSIDGVSEVDVAGVVHPNVILETDPDELRGNGLDVQRMVSVINRHAADRAWMGSLSDGPRAHEVYVDGRVHTLDELLRAPLDDAGAFTVADVSNMFRETRKGEKVFRINGKKAVRINVKKEKDRNTIRLARIVRQRVEEIDAELPAGLELTVLEDAAESLEKLIGTIFKLALTGGALAIVVLLFFMRSWRIALVVAASIPTSIIITFNAMYAFGISINMLTLLGLAFGVGMLVDNAIVVVENVFRHSARGLEPRQAAWLGSREVGRAIFAATATTLAVFVPMLFVRQSWVLFVQEMALSFIFPLAVSLMVALTLVPMLASRVVGRGTRRKSVGRVRAAGAWSARFNPWQRPGHRPRRLLREFVLFWARASLRHPIRLFFLVGGMLLITLVASMFKVAIQSSGRQPENSTLTLYGKARLGVDLDQVDQLFREKEEQVGRVVAASDVFESFSSQFDKNGGRLELKIAKKYRKHSKYRFFDVYDDLESKGERGAFQFRPFRQASRQDEMRRYARQRGGGGNESVRITGEGLEALLRAAEQVKELLEADEDVTNVTFETPLGDPEVHFQPDLELFRIMQANPLALRMFFQARDSGGINTNLILEEDDVQRRVTVLAKETQEDGTTEDEKKAPQTLSELKRLQLPLASGGVAPLDHLGSFAIRHPAPSITKKDRQRHVSVSFTLKPSYYRQGMDRARQDALKGFQREVSGLRLPAGVSAALAGTMEEVDESTQTWKQMLLLAMLAVYLVMAFCFNSLTLPAIVMLTIPLACIGSFWGVILANTTLDAVAMFGSVMLIGLVVNNGILLIEYARQLEQGQGFSRPRALMAAVSYRFRPILMTSLTTILAALPILFSSEAEKEIRSLISVFIGGIVVSAILSLVVVPTAYNVLAIWLERLKGIRRYRPRDYAASLGLLVPAVPRLAQMGANGSSGDGPSSTARLPSAPRPSSTARLPSAPSTAASGGTELRIEIDNVSKRYPAFRMKKLLRIVPSRTRTYGRRLPLGNQALSNVSLTIGPGMFGLLGPNGAGKTTLMKILTGLVAPSTGVVRVAGQDLRGLRREIRQYVSYLPQDFDVYRALTLDQFLNSLAPYLGFLDLPERRRKIDEVIEEVGLEDVRDVPMKRFSGGMRQRAGIAQFLLRPRPIIIVDEPTAGLDPVERVRFRLTLSRLARERIVILSTHIVDDITSSCRQLAVLNRGQVLYHGDLEPIKSLAEGRIWEVSLPAPRADEARRSASLPIPAKAVIHRKHQGDTILCHYVSDAPLPGSTSVPPTFEDAYVALLLRHNATENQQPNADE